MFIAESFVFLTSIILVTSHTLSIAGIQAQQWWIILASSLLYVAGIYLLIRSYGHFGVAKTTILMNVFATIIGLLFGWFFLHERFTAKQLIGVVVMMSGLMIFAL